MLWPVVVSLFGTTPLAGAGVAITAGSLAMRLFMLARTMMTPAKTKATTITSLELLLLSNWRLDVGFGLYSGFVIRILHAGLGSTWS